MHMRALLLVCAALAVACPATALAREPGDGGAGGARDAATAAASTGAMTALTTQPSYAPGQVAQLRVDADATRLTVQVRAAVAGTTSTAGSVAGDPAVTPARVVAWHPGAGTIAVRIGWWASGVYFFAVRGAGEAVAPVVVRPAQLGQSPVAVIVPTYTWEAYNRRDGDTWYVCGCVHTVDLARPYLGGGIPYNFGQYEQDLFHWLARNDVRVDVLADQDLDQIASGQELRRLYRMVVFEGHSEYATEHMYDVTEQYRNLGGHLAFLSANDFFRKVVVSGDAMTLIGRWRDLGRPEAGLLGAQYIGWFRNLYPGRPYRVLAAGRLPWLFAGTGLRDGSLIPGHFGIEIDGPGPASPPGTIVVADIPDIFPGETAAMTYYTTPAGAEVFDAGTINFGGAANTADVARMLANLWRHMTGITTLCPPSTVRRG
jgi:hypothetical protein